MSGRIGARGYVYQGIIAVLNCLETEVWDEIKVEPLTANDKVDIIMKKSGVVVKAIQVKSSDRKFEKPSIEKWIEQMVTDIEALKYELILIGGQYTVPASEYIDNVNGKGSNISIVKRNLNEDILLNMAKAEVTKFIQMHSSKKCGAIEIENIIKRLFADIMLISTNEKYYKKDDLIIMMEQNLIKGEVGRRILICFCRRSIFLIGFVLWLYISYITARIDFLNAVCVIISDLLVLAIWGLMKYSDYHYWNAPPEEPRIYYSSKKCSSKCNFLDVQIIQDNILYKQIIWIENIHKKDIFYVKGIIEFYSHKRKVYELPFEQHNIQSGKSVKIDDILERFERNYFEKISWNEVYLNIDKMRTQDDELLCWKEKIIHFYPVPDLEPIRYIKVGLIKVFPYELSWLYENVIEKILHLFKLLMTVSVGEYHKELWKHIKIRANGYVKMFVCRAFGIFMVGSVIGIILFVCSGQILLICNLFKGVL